MEVWGELFDFCVFWFFCVLNEESKRICGIRMVVKIFNKVFRIVFGIIDLLRKC